MSQVYGVFDADGFPSGGFWIDTLHGVDNIPDEAVEITDAQWRQFTSKQGRRALVNGVVVEKIPTVVELTPAERLDARLVRDEWLSALVEVIGDLPNQTVAGVRANLISKI